MKTNNPLNTILNIIHPRSIATVIISALIGPVAVVLTNRHIQNKNIQKDLIATVVETASSTDYSKAEAMEKIGIIAGIVQENRDVFGLSFKQTMSTVEHLKKRSTAVLYEEISLVENQIQHLERKTEKDSECILQLQEEKELLNKEIISLEKEKSDVTHYAQQKIDSLKYVKNQHGLKINTLESIRRLDNEKLILLNDRINVMQTDLQFAQQKMQLLLTENQEHKTTLNQTKKLLKQAEVDKQQLKQALLEIQQSLERQMERNEKLSEEVVGLQEENLRLGKVVLGK